jgi:phage shock protein A
MGLFKSIENALRKKADDLNTKLDNPVADGKFAIEDSKKEVEEFSLKVADLIAEEKGLERKRDAAQADVQKWADIAAKAAQSGNREDVTAAVQNKQQAEAQLATFTSEMAQDEQLISDLKAKLDKAREQIAQAEANLTRLSAREEGAKIREGLASSAGDFASDKSPLASLGNLEKSVEAEEDKAAALEQMSHDSTSGKAQSLEDKYSSTSSGVDDEVTRLMSAHTQPDNTK